jgi:hypothetical protein
MVRRRGPPSQGWKTFLRNHAPDIAAIDLFVARTIGFKLLYGLAIIHLERRRLVWTNVTANPTSEWIARQITEAFPWEQAPQYIIRDNDRSYGPVVTRRMEAKLGFDPAPFLGVAPPMSARRFPPLLDALNRLAGGGVQPERALAGPARVSAGPADQPRNRTLNNALWTSRWPL